nr:unnamed protein product [Callosobruchus chinensis]
MAVFAKHIPPRLIVLAVLFSFINSINGQDVPDPDFYQPVINLPKNPAPPSAKNIFSWEDYAVLAAMLIISCGIGVFYGFCGPKHENSEDFLLGGSSMGTFPMAMSLAASFVTAVELLGNPAEMYTHGSQFWMICIAFVLVIPLSCSSYEYFALRFSPKTRYIAAGLYVFQMVLYTSVAVYAPALALSKVTGLNVYVAVTAVYAGGMKAVIIADTFQAGVLIGSLFLIVYFGEKFLGGRDIIWSESFNTGRLDLFDLDPNLTVRHSFWSVVIGGTFYWMTMFCSNQASIQKYLSVQSQSQVKKAIWTSCIGLIIIYSVNFYTGMIMVAHYRECDPIKSGEIRAADEILPLYVISTMGHLKGVTGFFVAGIFAASLGTVASALNSLSAVTIQDFLGSALGIHLPDKKGAYAAQLLSVLYGAISFGLVFVIANLGSIMQVAISFNGMVGGVTLGLFSLGMFFPWANSKGAIFGATVATCLITLMCIGQQVAIANGTFEEKSKPTSIENCCCLNVTKIGTKDVIPDSEPIFFLYRISYIWYSGFGFLITVILGLIGSVATGATNPKDIDEELLSPPLRDFLHSLSNSTKEFLNIPLKQGSIGKKTISIISGNKVKEPSKVKFIHTQIRKHGIIDHHNDCRWWVRPIFQERNQKEQFDQLLNLVEPKLLKRSRREYLRPEFCLAMTLKYLAHGGSFQTLSWEFRVGRSTVSKKHVLFVLWDVLQPIYLSTTSDAWKNIAEEFLGRRNSPHTIGAIDGKNVHIQCPINTGSAYYNYKGYSSIVFLACCDADYKFTWVDIGAYDHETISRKAEGKNLSSTIASRWRVYRSPLLCSIKTIEAICLQQHIHTPPTLVDYVTEDEAVVDEDWRAIIRNDTNLTPVGRVGSNIAPNILLQCGYCTVVSNAARLNGNTGYIQLIKVGNTTEHFTLFSENFGVMRVNR